MISLKCAIPTNALGEYTSVCWCPPLNGFVHFGVPFSEDRQRELLLQKHDGVLHYITLEDIIEYTELSLATDRKEAEERFHAEPRSVSWAPLYNPNCAHLYKSDLPCSPKLFEWRYLQSNVHPGIRLGHHLLYCRDLLFLLGGIEVETFQPPKFDFVFFLNTGKWKRTRVPVIPRYAASVAVSEARHTTDETVAYFFGGVSFQHVVTNTLHRFWLPSGNSELLPQTGAVPPPQFGGQLIVDSLYESPLRERAWRQMAKNGSKPHRRCNHGRLFYLDGQTRGGEPLFNLRTYDLFTGMWTIINVFPSFKMRRAIVTSRSALGCVRRMQLIVSNEDATEASRVLAYSVTCNTWDYTEILPRHIFLYHVFHIPESTMMDREILRRHGVSVIGVGKLSFPNTLEDENAVPKVQEEVDHMREYARNSWLFVFNPRNPSLNEKCTAAVR